MMRRAWRGHCGRERFSAGCHVVDRMIVEYVTVVTREMIYTLDSESMQGRYNRATIALRAYSS